ncbi:hypothetical protein NA57DRAFT_70136 [Rhizodiscina lignyota]|uniref:Cytochrome b561 domain-containing protein n=1 Tax=Rhizodiscina lignyota TaxID=1504668 RepID=A0A9P4IQI9_9PEZI|nr:hypothetical protein NA57DRAFT_70136 [Rhizodiscina lignyota]
MLGTWEYTLALTALLMIFSPVPIFGQEVQDYEKRDFSDSFIVFNRLRNGHACIMSITFIVLYPLGAISIHLPIESMPFLRNTYLKQKVLAIHAPIQIIGFLMMCGGMGLGIRLAHDLDFFNNPVHAHVVIGLLVCSVIILFQPAMGVIQHLHYRKTGGKSIFAYLHRWTGRCAIILGMINSGLGFQLAKENVIIRSHSYIRNYVLLGILVAIWFALVVWDQFKPKAPRNVTDGGEKGVFEKPASDALPSSDPVLASDGMTDESRR